MKDCTIDAIIGERLTYVDIDPCDNKIKLTTESGREFMIHHHQDCCESVEILSHEGEWEALYGKVVRIATHEESQTTELDGSTTNTTLTFVADSTTVISRWVGDSNGYYSESVHISEITADRD